MDLAPTSRPEALLIAFDSGNIYLLRRFLDRCGLETVVADPEAAAPLLASSPPLVVFDVDGPLSADARALPAICARRRIPIIICSWDDGVGRYGAAPLLQKPLRYESFLALLRAINAEGGLSFTV